MTKNATIHMKDLYPPYAKIVSVASWVSVIFFVINALFAIYALNTGCCQNNAFWSFFERHIPAITTIINYLHSTNNPARANLVRAVYGFNWASFLLANLLLLSYLFIHCYTLYKMAPHEKLRTVIRADSNKNRVLAIVKLLLAVVFIWCPVIFLIYPGYYEFGHYAPYANQVQWRNLDLFVSAALFTACLYFWGFLGIALTGFFAGYKTN